MGGYAAMLFGIAAGADAMLAFSPQSRFDVPFCLDVGETRWREAYDEMLDEYDVEQMALQNRWPSELGGLAEVHFGGRCPVDCAYAAQILDLSGSRLVRHDDMDHDLVHGLRKSGELESIIHRRLQAL